MQNKPKLTIHRFAFAPVIELPVGAVFLDAQVGMSGPSLWFLVDPEAEKENRTFSVVGTGQPLPEAILDCQHLATVKAVILVAKDGENQAVPTALHFFDTTQAKVAIPTIDPTKPQPADPADWWKQA